MQQQSLWKVLVFALLLPTSIRTLALPRAARPTDETLTLPGEIGVRGGRLTVDLRPEPRTLNPITALDASSKEVIPLLFADLIHINVFTQKTEPALAKSWKVSADGRTYTLELRRGIFFSDGHPFDADDVMFSFKVYLDEKLQSPQRDLLEVNGKPIQVRKLGPFTIAVDLPEPYAAAERLFDNVSILPRHLLEQAYVKGELGKAWNLTADPSGVAGLGPFRLKQYIAGQKLVLERNPYYWKTDAAKNRLPYLDELVIVPAASEDAEVIRFQAGDLDVIDNINAENFSVLEKEQAAKQFRIQDLGAGMVYEFLFFNLNDLSSKQLPEISRKQQWFRNDAFRQAVSAAIDRNALVRLVYRGHAAALASEVTPANKLWLDSALPRPVQSLEKAQALLRSAGFSRDADGKLVDSHGAPVEFSIAVNPGNQQRTRMATMVQEDLNRLGMQVHIVPLESGSLMTRLGDSLDYEACMLGLLSGDADPNPEINTWISTGSSHYWAPVETKPLAPWQAEIDRLMQQQTSVLDYKKRKQIYDRVQEILAEHLPVIFLISPDVLVGAKNSLKGIRPAALRHHLLWNVEQIYWAPASQK
ncbi:MAG TPA: ABC transporter substrate-binding protein [Candidatus Angelobacter sp.]|jgi:peptide/nickel transport system substrate-binding protein